MLVDLNCSSLHSLLGSFDRFTKIFGFIFRLFKASSIISLLMPISLQAFTSVVSREMILIVKAFRPWSTKRCSLWSPYIRDASSHNRLRLFWAYWRPNRWSWRRRLHLGSNWLGRPSHCCRGLFTRKSFRKWLHTKQKYYNTGQRHKRGQRLNSLMQVTRLRAKINAPKKNNNSGRSEIRCISLEMI